MGPGGYRFGDYLNLGLPLTLLVTLVSVPLILIIWPL
jgi:di/tricarboxylate transporter